MTVELERGATLPDDRECLVRVRYTAGRPAPPCSNPDSPAFSDSGDPPELEILSTRVEQSDGSYREEQLGDLTLEFIRERLLGDLEDYQGEDE